MHPQFVKPKPQPNVFRTFLAAKGAAQQATICGGGGDGGVHTQAEIHLSPFKC